MVASSLPPSYEPNPALRLLYRWFFDNIQVDDDWVRQVRRLADRGTVVYVLRSLNAVDFLALDHLTKRFDLPRIHYVNDLRLGVFNPLNRGIIQTVIGLTRRSVREQLAEALDNGGSAALFLKRPPGMLDVATGASSGRGLSEGDEHIRCLLELPPPARNDEPVLLVPQVFSGRSDPTRTALSARPRARAARVAQRTAHDRAVPHALSSPWSCARVSRSISSATSTAGGSDRPRDVRRIIYALLRRLERERRSVTGRHSPHPTAANAGPAQPTAAERSRTWQAACGGSKHAGPPRFADAARDASHAERRDDPVRSTCCSMGCFTGSTPGSRSTWRGSSACAARPRELDRAAAEPQEPLDYLVMSFTCTRTTCSCR